MININHLNRPAPRIVHAVAELAETFHPEAYAEARTAAESTPTESNASDPDSAETEQSYANVSEPSSSDSSPSETTPDESAPVEEQPGFGVPVALVALAVGLLGAKRRSDRSHEP